MIGQGRPDRRPQSARALSVDDAQPADPRYRGVVQVTVHDGKRLIGPRAAERLIATRRGTVLRGADDLRRLGVYVTRGGHFMALGGKRLAPRAPAQQLRLFTPGGHLPSVVWNTPVPPCAYR